MTRIILAGALGRMGKQIAENAGLFNMLITAGVDTAVSNGKTDFPVYSSFDPVSEEADVIIDFSSPALLPSLLEFAQKNSLPVILAATGYSQSDIDLINEASKKIAVFRSANMSIGVHVLKLLSKRASDMLSDFDIEIVERHHNQKKDAPSGTALMLLDAIRSDDTVPVFGRSGNSCKRDEKEIGVHAIRGGSVAGEHEVGFYGQQESILLTHRAQSRSVFAHGALRAAEFMIGQKPGQYNMNDMIRF